MNKEKTLETNDANDYWNGQNGNANEALRPKVCANSSVENWECDGKFARRHSAEESETETENKHFWLFITWRDRATALENMVMQYMDIQRIEHNTSKRAHFHHYL